MTPPKIPLRREPKLLFDLTDVQPTHTGLPFVVFMQAGMGHRYSMRIKVAPAQCKVPRSQMATVAIRPTLRVISGELNRREFALLRRWIDLNIDVLVSQWDGDIDSKAALDNVRPL